MRIPQTDPKREEALKHFAKEWSLSLTNEILNEATTHPSFKGISPKSKDYECLETKIHFGTNFISNQFLVIFCL